MAAVPYPSPEEPGFGRALLRKREFWTDDVAEGDGEAGAGFDITPVQHFVSVFMSPTSPYRSILLFHGVGAGKTCAAVRVAEAFQESGDGKQPVVILPSHLRFNFRNSLLDPKAAADASSDVAKDWSDRKAFMRTLCTHSYADLSGGRVSADFVRKSVQQRSGRAYRMYGHEQFGNLVEAQAERANDMFESEEARRRERESRLRALFDGRVIVVDEAHIMLPSGDSMRRKSYLMLMEVLTVCRSARLVLLTATPMFDNARSLVSIVNLMLANERLPTLSPAQVFDDASNLTPRGERYLEAACRGRVSYVASGFGPEFPLVLCPPPAADPSLRREKRLSASGHPVPAAEAGLAWSDPRMVFHAMTPNQIRAVDALRGADSDKAANQKAMSQVCLLSFDGKAYPGGDENIRAALHVSEGSAGYQVSYRGARRHFSPEHLRDTSPKMAAVVEAAVRSKGAVFVFSDYNSMGVLPLLVALEEHGFTPVQGRTLLKDAPRGVPHRGHYVDITRKMYTDRGRSIPEKVQDANDPRAGVKVIVGGSSAKHGISFLGVREVHLLHPHWNMSLVDQVVGRANRRMSHARLPPEQRNFTVHIHCATVRGGDTETIDENQVRYALRKIASVNRVVRLMRRVAADCGIQPSQTDDAPLRAWPQLDARGQRVPRGSPRLAAAPSAERGMVCESGAAGKEDATDTSTTQAHHYAHQTEMAAWDVMAVMMRLGVATFEEVSVALRPRRDDLVLSLALTALLHPMRESRWSAGTEVTLVQRGDRYFAAPRAMAGAMFTMRELREGALFGSASRAVPVPVPAREKKR